MQFGEELRSNIDQTQRDVVTMEQKMDVNQPPLITMLKHATPQERQEIEVCVFIFYYLFICINVKTRVRGLMKNIRLGSTIDYEERRFKYLKQINNISKEHFNKLNAELNFRHQQEEKLKQEILTKRQRIHNLKVFV